MRRWLLPAGATTADDLVVEEVDAPLPGDGQVRLRVGAVALNARDRMILAGPFGRSPGQALVPLSDVAGSIAAVGAGVTGWAVGDRVMTAHVPSWPDGPPPAFGPGPGSLGDPGVAAQDLVVAAAALVATPDHLDDAEAATLQVAGVTAWNALFGAHPVRAGDRVLVIGSGGVSLYAAQLSLAVGARVVAAVRSGAVATDEPGWGRRVREQTGGATKVVDTVGGGPVLAECLAALAGGGEVAVPGLVDMSPTEVDVLTMIGAQTSLRGVAVGSVRMHRDLAAFLALHDLHPVVQHRVPFDRLPDAYRALDAAATFGKVVVEVA